jgi:hypothetical protein
MTVVGTLLVLRSRWYVTLIGMVVSCVAACLVFNLAPAQYTSTGVAVLVQPRYSNVGASANPLLNFDPSLSTTALIIVQTLDTAQADDQLGLEATGDSYTIEQASSADSGAGQIVQPFIYVRTRAHSAEASASIVRMVIDSARQGLVAQQKELDISPQSYIRLNDVYTTPPKRLLGIALAATAAVLLMGFFLTIASALLLTRAAVERQRRRGGVGYEAERDRRSAPEVDRNGLGSPESLNNGSTMPGESLSSLSSRTN